MQNHSAQSLLVAIPTYDGEQRILCLLEQLSKRGFLDHSLIDLIVIENPYHGSSLSSSIGKYTSVKYIQNDSQIGLHGSWFKAVSLAQSYDWMVVLGDDDIFDTTADVLSRQLNQHCLADVGFLFASDPLPSDSRLKEFRNKKVSASIFLDSSDIHYGFGFLSNVFFRPTQELCELTEIVLPKISKTDCLHYIVLLAYALKYNCLIFLSSALVVHSNIFVGEPDLQSSVVSRSLYAQIVGSNSLPYQNLLIWLRTYYLMRSLANQIEELPPHMSSICRNHLRRSFRLWSLSSRLGGIFVCIRCMFLGICYREYWRLLRLILP